MKKLVGIIVLLIVHVSGYTQEIDVKGGFLVDTIKVGEPFSYYLTVSYPQEMEVVFPDSTYDFKPYDFYNKISFKTKVSSDHLIDSAVYTLASFELDTWQKMKLPVYLIKKQDSVSLYADTDSVYLMQLTSQVTDTTSVVPNLAFQEVETEINLPYLYIGLFALIAALFIVLLLFGKKINKTFVLRRLKRDYTRFSNQFDQIIQRLGKENSPEEVEKGALLWKHYLEKLEKKPYSSQTTKELINSGIDNKLVPSLKNIDKSIYGQLAIDNIHKDFEILDDFTLEKYHNKLEEVKNG